MVELTSILLLVVLVSLLVAVDICGFSQMHPATTIHPGVFAMTEMKGNTLIWRILLSLIKILVILLIIPC